MPGKWVLLNPGPSNTSERVQAALGRGDLCHREQEFSELLDRVRRRLTGILNLVSYEVALLAGSGTAAMEMGLAHLVEPGRAILVLNNGLYGERLVRIARARGIPVHELVVPWGERPSPGMIEERIREHPDVRGIALVHHETSTAMLNPLEEAAEAARRHDCRLFVDAISSVGTDPIDPEALGADLVACSANKGLHGFPGVSFLYVSQRLRRELPQRNPGSLYLDLRELLDYQERGDTPFTPAIQVLYALDEALAELEERGGIPARLAEYRVRAAFLRRALRQMGLRFLVPEEQMGHSLTVVWLPEGWSYAELHDRLKERGFVIYEAQGALATTAFRVAHMGEIDLEVLGRFAAALEEVLAEGPSTVAGRGGRAFRESRP